MGVQLNNSSAVSIKFNAIHRKDTNKFADQHGEKVPTFRTKIEKFFESITDIGNALKTALFGKYSQQIVNHSNTVVTCLVKGNVTYNNSTNSEKMGSKENQERSNTINTESQETIKPQEITTDIDDSKEILPIIRQSYNLENNATNVYKNTSGNLYQVYNDNNTWKCEELELTQKATHEVEIEASHKYTPHSFKNYKVPFKTIKNNETQKIIENPTRTEFYDKIRANVLDSGVYKIGIGTGHEYYQVHAGIAYPLYLKPNAKDSIHANSFINYNQYIDNLNEVKNQLGNEFEAITKLNDNNDSLTFTAYSQDMKVTQKVTIETIKNNDETKNKYNNSSSKLYHKDHPIEFNATYTKSDILIDYSSIPTKNIPDNDNQCLDKQTLEKIKIYYFTKNGEQKVCNLKTLLDASSFTLSDKPNEFLQLSAILNNATESSAHNFMNLSDLKSAVNQVFQNISTNQNSKKLEIYNQEFTHKITVETLLNNASYLINVMEEPISKEEYRVNNMVDYLAINLKISNHINKNKQRLFDDKTNKELIHPQPHSDNNQIVHDSSSSRNPIILESSNISNTDDKLINLATYVNVTEYKTCCSNGTSYRLFQMIMNDLNSIFSNYENMSQIKILNIMIAFFSNLDDETIKKIQQKASDEQLSNNNMAARYKEISNFIYNIKNNRNDNNKLTEILLNISNTIYIPTNRQGVSTKDKTLKLNIDRVFKQKK